MKISNYIDPLYRTLVGVLFIIIGASIIVTQHNSPQTNINILGPSCSLIGLWLLYTGAKNLYKALKTKE